MKLGIRRVARRMLHVGLAPLLAGCAGGNGTNNNGNTADPNAGRLEATVTFPDVIADPEPAPEQVGGLKVVAISQEGGISGNFFGTATAEGMPVVITGFEGETGDGDFLADFDEQARLERVTIADTDVTFDYTKGDTFTYTVRRGGELVISGSGISVPRTARAHGPGLHQRIEAQDISACSDATIAAVADSVVRDLEGNPTATAEPEFVSCLQAMIEVPQVAEMVCVSDSVLIPALEAALAKCDANPNPVECRDRVEPALASAGFFSAICSIAATDVIRQIREAPDLCPLAACVGESQLVVSGTQLQASSTFGSEFTVSNLADGDPMTYWFSDGCTGGPNETVDWASGATQPFARVELDRENFEGRHDFGFCFVQFIVFAGDQVTYNSEQLALDGCDVEIDYEFTARGDFAACPQGDRLQIVLSDHEDCTCGGFSELRVFSN